VADPFLSQNLKSIPLRSNNPSQRHLAWLSQSPGSTDLSKYNLRREEGAGAYLYIFDSGFDLNHPEISAQNIEPIVGTNNLQNANHGTCMIAVAVGLFEGVVAGATVVPYAILGTLPSLTNAFVSAANDVVSRGLGGKAVILVTGGCTYS
jgi:hypothetical protein